ncbi:MAG: hypothetical protein AAFX54_03100 [Pseudomonadota bacterium]
MPIKNRRKLPVMASLTGAALLLAAAPAHACYTVHVDNQTTKNIYSVWTADGCMGIDHWRLKACSQALINAGESKSYNYKWGVTVPVVFLFQKLTLEDKPEYTASYGFGSGKFKLDNDSGLHMGSPGGCGGNYTITFTEELRKKWLES